MKFDLEMIVLFLIKTQKLKVSFIKILFSSIKKNLMGTYNKAL